MGFLYNDNILDDEIKQIKLLIRLSMNGVTADSMKDHGILYKQNYGVSIIRLKEIAQQFGKKHDLAQRLRNLDMRETKILATMIQPVESFTREMADKWQDECTNIELKEQAIMNLYRHAEWAVDLSLNNINSSEIQKQIFGWMLAGRVTKTMQKIHIDELLTVGLYKTELNDPNTVRAVAVTMAALCRKNAETANQIKNLFFDAKLQIAEDISLIKDSVKQELIFLGYVPEDF